MTGATDEYRKDMDLVGRWIEDCCLLHPQASETSVALYDSYKTWAHDELGFFMTKLVFTRDLGRRSYLTKAKVHGLRGWRGLRLPPL